MRSIRQIRLDALPKFWVLALTALALVCVPLLTMAVTVYDLYSATVRVADRSASAREQAVGEALAVVLTKLSGQKALAVRIASAQTDTARLVQRVGYVSGGQLEVGFDSERINGLLDQSGMPFWDRVRPVSLIVLPSALQGLPEVRAALELAAKDRGLPIVWAETENSDGIASKALAQIQTLGAQYGAQAVLLTRLAGGAASSAGTPANLRWQLVFDGTSQEWSGALDEGVGLIAEEFSRYYAVSGKQVSQHLLEVSGVGSVQSYGQITNYLSTLLTVRRVSVQGLKGDVLHLQLEVRGTQVTLRRLLAVDKQLNENESSNAEAADVLRYRYNP